jgi:hypothetical protein
MSTDGYNPLAVDEYIRKYPRRNDNSCINNTVFIEKLLKVIERKLEREVTISESNYVTSIIRTINPDLVRGKTIKGALLVLARICLNELNTPKPEKIDIHELLKAEIGQIAETDSAQSRYDSILLRQQRRKREEENEEERIMDLVPPAYQVAGTQRPIGALSDFLGATTILDLRRFLLPQTLYQKKSIVLDSRYRILTGEGISTSITKFSWDHINNLATRQGTVNTTGTLKDIVALRVLPLRIPYMLSADTAQKRITIHIEEFTTQSFIAHEDRKFHFMFKTNIDGNYIELEVYTYNNGIFEFEKPITTLDTITISFASPILPIIFDPDRTTYTIAYGAISTITTPINHGLLTSDIVYFDNFTTVTPVVDSATIETINRSNGHPITFVSNTSFTINVNTIGLGAVPAGLTLFVYFGSKRFYIPIEITYINPL